MIKSSEIFSFAGETSDKYNIVNININEGMLQDPFYSNRNFNKARIKGRNSSYFQNIQNDPKVFELQLAFDDSIKVTNSMLRAVQNWLCKNDGFHPLYFLEDCEPTSDGYDFDITKPKRIYMAVAIGSSNFNHFGLGGGYFNVTFETDSDVCYSLERGNYDYNVGEAVNTDDEQLDSSKVYFFNHGDFVIKPQIKIQVAHVSGTDVNNQGIRITGEAIDDLSLGGNSEPNDGFERSYPIPTTDYSKFPAFCFSEGKSASGFFQLLGTVFYGEKMVLGNNTYEFDLGYGKCYNKLESNILVPVTAKKANNTLVFNENSWVEDGSTVTIGDQCFEYDYNDLVSSQAIKVDISNYVGRATGRLHLSSNLLPNQKFKVGDITYTMIGGTNELIVKMSDHLLTDGSEINYLVNTDRNTLVSDNVNISTKHTRNISQCLLRNITKNSSDLGIRKMKYLDKNFVMCLWDSESGEDYQNEIDNVPINGRLVLTFDNQVNESTINNDTIQCRNIEGNQIQLTFDISKDKKIIGVTPKTAYNSDADYYLYVSKGVKDIKGNSFSQVRKIKFHTKKDGDSTASDSYNNVSAVKVFSIYSSKKIDSSTVTDSNVYVTKSGSGTHEEVNVKILDMGKSFSVSPRAKYEYGQSYTLHVTTGVKDVDGNSILSAEKKIDFTVQAQTNETVVTDDFEIITNAFVDKSISIPFTNRLSEDYLNTNTVVLEKENGDRVPIYVERSLSTPNILLVTPQGDLSYNTIYYLYVSGAVSYYDNSNIENPRKFKVITMTEDYAKNYNAPITNVQMGVPETGNLNQLHTDYTLVNTDKIITYDFDKTLDATTINNTNIYILDKNSNKYIDYTAQVGLAGEGIKISPNTVWEPDSSYSIYITPNVKITDKPRVFVAYADPDSGGNLGDYDNALDIFGKLGFEVIKTNDKDNNPYTVQGNAIVDKNGNIVQFKSTDIIIGDDTSYKSSDFDSNKNIKNGTVVVTIPRSVMTYEAKRIYGKDRIKTKEYMQKWADTIKNDAWITQQLYTEDTKILTFTTKLNNEKISIDLDGSISLDDNTLLITEIPKKIVGQTAGDTINLYEDRNDKMDFVIDSNMVIPNKIPQGAKAYAGRASDGETNPNKDDYNNAVEVLTKVGYLKENIIDTTTMKYEDKTKIVFHEGDLVIGGELAGSTSKDFDENGNLKTTSPQADDPNDTRLERISGIPRGISIYPARRLQGSGDDCTRTGTKKAMDDWVNLIKNANDGKTLESGYITNGVLNGVAVKYKIPNDACVYSTGCDFYNGLKYLGDMGYKFVNVGLMSLAEKMSLPFKEGDLVLGDVGASDTVASSGGTTSTTVTGVPSINIGKAKRLGGADRYETEKIIKAFAESLKPKGVEAGDIVKLKITIDSADNDGIIKTDSQNGYEGSQSKTSSGINENTRVEYHRVKAVKQLARNRMFIEFEEDIRTLHYIKEIEITDLYKLYETRIAENYLFTAPYQILIGDTKTITMLDIVKAINNTGTTGVEYSLYTFKHSVVLAQIASDDEIELDAIEYGSKGNIPVSLVDKLDPKNRFLTPSLEGGKDCTQDNAIVVLAKSIEKQNDKKERYNKDQYTVSYDSTSLTITHKMCGEKYNDIICLANVAQQIQSPYLITNTGTNVDNGSLINLKDFLIRQKQVAKWQNFTLIDGEDPTIEECIRALMRKIKEKQSTEIVVTYFKKDDGSDDKTGFNIEYAEIGEIGNIPLNTTCVNGRLSGKKLKGGLDGLQVGEVILMDGESQTIVSSTGKDRYKNFTGGWLSVPLSGVMLKIRRGNFTITFAYREKYYI
ncbi:Ig-like domain-containing protein [Clostridium aciditolerans]|uniref:Ig-like domain-containing protein n=1 Tax=Clostridium aciditolerans TaxID=339861 RepID=A0A934M5Z7_9CLOT|nr:Ig-like domain-containing protein [Clostridium aciditolerans]MBI6875610.1 Ig-like domain-containing protein [Clostridium aciditolerans]